MCLFSLTPSCQSYIVVSIDINLHIEQLSHLRMIQRQYTLHYHHIRVVDHIHLVQPRVGDIAVLGDGYTAAYYQLLEGGVEHVEVERVGHVEVVLGGLLVGLEGAVEAVPCPGW